MPGRQGRHEKDAGLHKRQRVRRQPAQAAPKLCHNRGRRPRRMPGQSEGGVCEGGQQLGGHDGRLSVAAEQAGQADGQCARQDGTRQHGCTACQSTSGNQLATVAGGVLQPSMRAAIQRAPAGGRRHAVALPMLHQSTTVGYRFSQPLTATQARISMIPVSARVGRPVRCCNHAVLRCAALCCALRCC